MTDLQFGFLMVFVLVCYICTLITIRIAKQQIIDAINERR